MTRFWALLEESVLVTGIITLAFVSVLCYLVVVGRPVPDWLLHVLWIIMGFFFGAKTQRGIDRREARRREVNLPEGMEYRGR